MVKKHNDPHCFFGIYFFKQNRISDTVRNEIKFHFGSNYGKIIHAISHTGFSSAS